MSLEGNDEKTNEFTFKWRIEHFSLFLLENQTILSPLFRIEQLQNTQWNLTLDLPGKDKRDVVLNLRRERDQGPSKITVNGKLFIAKNNGSYIVLKKGDIDFNLKTTYIDGLVVTRISVLENPNEFLLEDTLTVGYKFFISSEDSHPTITECSARSKLSLKEYSFLLPLKLKHPEIFSSWDYSTVSLPIASTSTEYPVIQMDLKYRHFNQSENIITINIHLTKILINGFFQCKLSFFNEEDTKYECKTDYVLLDSQHEQLQAITISKDTFNKNAIFNATYLKCEISVSDGEFNSVLEKTVYKYKTHEYFFNDFRGESHLQSNLYKLYCEKSLCDFKVIVSDKEFPTHKTVLAAVSPVFRAMFEIGMTETEKSQVTIEEFSVATVEKMLEFSYNGNVKDLSWNVTLDLYHIADKYQIEKLKKVCSSFLKSALTVETVVDVLSLADLHKDTHLSEAAKGFISSNSKAVFRSDAWKHFMENNLQVASETMYHFCKLY